MSAKEYFVGNAEMKGILERSAVLTFFGTMVSQVVFAWSEDLMILEHVKNTSEVWLPQLLLVFGVIKGNPSKK